MYGHVEKLAHEIQKGAASVEGVEAKLWQVARLVPRSKIRMITRTFLSCKMMLDISSYIVYII